LRVARCDPACAGGGRPAVAGRRGTVRDRQLHFATAPPNRQTQHVAIVPLAQWLMTFVVTAFVLLATIAGRQTKADGDAKLYPDQLSSK